MRQLHAGFNTYKTMRTRQLFLLIFLSNIFLLPAMANINSHFSSINSDPNALYAFFKEMPKGGELHYHLAGGAYPEDMLAIAVQNDYCFNPKTQSISKNTPCAAFNSKTLIDKYTLYPTIIRAWSMQDFIAGKESNSQHFFNSFNKFMPIVFDFRPQLLAKIMQRAADQHELYLEIMILPDNGNSTNFGQLISNANNYAAKKRILLSNKDFQANINHTVTESNRILQQARHELKCNQNPNQPVCAITVKFQYYLLREQPLDGLFAQALNGFEAASRSNMIVGINLVQPENGVISLRDYKKQMAILEFLHQSYPNVNIALHAGELDPGSVPPEDLRFHIHDAIFIGKAKRIGHGADIAQENDAEKLLTYMATTPIPVEINLISNRKILGVYGKAHPLNYYLAHHVPVVLSTDDEGVLRTDITQQYVEAARAQNLDYSTLKTINRNALTYSFLPGKSLWSNTTKHTIVHECEDLFSVTCKQFIRENEKARLQWQLEKDLIVFESRF